MSEDVLNSVSKKSKVDSKLITFDRYFISTGRPLHHRAGMVAYAKNVKGKRTRESWDSLFKTY